MAILTAVPSLLVALFLFITSTVSATTVVIGKHKVDLEGLGFEVGIMNECANHFLDKEPSTPLIKHQGHELIDTAMAILNEINPYLNAEHRVVLLTSMIKGRQAVQSVSEEEREINCTGVYHIIAKTQWASQQRGGKIQEI